MLLRKFLPKIILLILLVTTFTGCSIIETIQPQYSSTTSPIIKATTINTPSPNATLSTILTITNSPTPELSLSGVIACSNLSRVRAPIVSIDLENKIIQDLSNSGSASLSWSPDGLWLVFDGMFSPSQQSDLYKVKADGSELTRLTNSPQGKSDVAWSPDGRSIIFAYSNKGNPTDLAIIGKDGSSYYLLTGTKGSERNPTWSPDGKQIAYTYSENDRASEELWIMDAYGKNPKRLSAVPFVYGGIDWSPNGEWIAFVSGENADECGDIYIIRPDGSELSRLTHLPGCANAVVWSPNGDFLAFIGSEKNYGNIMDGKSQIYVMELASKAIVAITNDKGWFIRDIDWGVKTKSK